LVRMLPSVIGSMGLLKGAMPRKAPRKGAVLWEGVEGRSREKPAST
jgi:hypothetical protein